MSYARTDGRPVLDRRYPWERGSLTTEHLTSARAEASEPRPPTGLIGFDADGSGRVVRPELPRLQKRGTQRDANTDDLALAA